MIKKYIEKSMGQFFIKPIIYSLDEVYLDSRPYAPIILILTPGNDPMEQIKKYGEEKAKLPYPVSLGKGQGEKAKALINEIK
jgi:dynein heavy chain